jgi:hypothetical protein
MERGVTGRKKITPQGVSRKLSGVWEEKKGTFIIAYKNGEAPRHSFYGGGGISEKESDH